MAESGFGFALQNSLCSSQEFRWHSTEQYLTRPHPEHFGMNLDVEPQASQTRGMCTVGFFRRLHWKGHYPLHSAAMLSKI